MPPRKYLPPDPTKPLDEPTLNRRVWAAYLAVGMNRAEFARAVGAPYNLATAWDMGTVGMGLSYLMKVRDLVGYTLDELVYGHDAKQRAGREGSLNDAALAALLDELRAPQAPTEALGRYRRSDAGSLVRFTRTFVATFVEVYAAQLGHEGVKPATALQRAVDTAGQARDRADALDSGFTPLDPAALREAFASAKPAVVRKRRAKRKTVSRVATTRATRVDTRS